MSDRQQPAAVDYTPTHRVARVSKGAPDPLRIFFQALGRSLEWPPADAEDGGGAQDVPAAVATAIVGDPTLAPHFRVEAIAAVEGAERAERPRPRPREEAVIRKPAE